MTQLVEVIDYIGSLLDCGKQTDVIYLDMSKALNINCSTLSSLVNYASIISVVTCLAGSHPTFADVDKE